MWSSRGDKCGFSIVNILCLLLLLASINCQLVARPYDKNVQEFINPEDGVALLCCERIILDDSLSCDDLEYSWEGPRVPEEYSDRNLYLPHKRNIFEQYYCTAKVTNSQDSNSVSIKFTVDHERDEPQAPSYALFYTLIVLVFVFTGLCLFAVIYNYCYIFKPKVAQDEESLIRDQLPLPVPNAGKQSVKDSTYETMPTDLPVPPYVTQQQQKEPIKQTPKTTPIPKVVEPGQKLAEPKEHSSAKAAKTPSNKVAPATAADGEKHPSPKAAASKQSKRSKKSSKKADHKSPKPEKKPVTAEMPKVEDPAMPSQQTADSKRKEEPTDAPVEQPKLAAEGDVKQPTPTPETKPQQAEGDALDQTPQQGEPREEKGSEQPEQKTTVVSSEYPTHVSNSDFSGTEFMAFERMPYRKMDK